MGGGAQVGQVAIGAISEADRHNIRGEHISVDTIPLVGEQPLAEAVRAVARLPRAKALVLAGSLMGGEIEAAVREVRAEGILVVSLNMAGSVPDAADLVVSDPVQAGVMTVMAVAETAQLHDRPAEAAGVLEAATAGFLDHPRHGRPNDGWFGRNDAIGGRQPPKRGANAGTVRRPPTDPNWSKRSMAAASARDTLPEPDREECAMTTSRSRRSFLVAGLALPVAAEAAIVTPKPAAPPSLAPAASGKPPVIRKRKLGKTGMEVSEVAFGCMITSDQSVIERAADLGVNLFDTARVYQGGNNERLVGAALKGRRDKLYVSTKTVAPDQGRGARPPRREPAPARHRPRRHLVPARARARPRTSRTSCSTRSAWRSSRARSASPA